MITGIVFGAVCAAIVWAIGFTFVSKSDSYGGGIGAGFALAFRIMLRGALGISSLVAAGVGLFITISGHADWAPFTGWLVTYLAGVFAYFVVRYGIPPLVKH
ncbi:MAG TPA: hypothetical protein V6D22_16565 [Candidatus Obscuribacterales bacterium]